MKRQIMQKLSEWKARQGRKPLLLKGARQVGKTFCIKQFGAEKYRNCVYLNFEDKPRLRQLFDASLEPEKILKAISVEMECVIVPGETLIVFDEVQECPGALNSLKYFCENAPEHHVIAAGSLLGVKLAHTQGFPVGKVQFLTMYPLNFFEFLEALGEYRLLEFVHEIKTADPLPPNLHDKLIDRFKEYLFVGGMPEAVYEYTKSQQFPKVREIQQAILDAYNLDFAKHAPKDQVMKISQVWGSIPSQIAKENKKFIFSIIRTGARAKEFEIAIQWLLEAGLIYKIPLITTPKIPLSVYVDISAFKAYMVDVGLLGAMAGLSAKTVVHKNELFQEFRGSITENYVAQELINSGVIPYYWGSEGRAELDFVIEFDEFIYPIEVKSGQSTKKKSLKVYADHYHPKICIRCSPKNLKKDGAILNCPLYLLGKLCSSDCDFLG
jgi:predicted AAA+ superfamily ATPase